MKRIALILLFGLISIALQSSVLKVMLPNSIIPNFILILVVFIAFYECSTLGAVIAFLLGFEIDIYSGQLLGPYAAASVAVFCVLSSLSQRIFVESPVAILLTVFSSLCFLSSLRLPFVSSTVTQLPIVKLKSS